MQTQPPSQIAEQYVMSAYPCLGGWISFIKDVSAQLLEYSPTACLQISAICQATMKTLEYIQQNEPYAVIVRVMRLLDDLYNTAWQGWTAFGAQANFAAGTRALQTAPDVLSGLALFQQWDSALAAQPAFDPSATLVVMFGGVSA